MPEDLDSTLAEILSAALMREVKPGEFLSRDETSAWDSLKHMEIVFAVEAAFDISLPEDVIGEIKNTSELRRAVERLNAP